MNRADAGAGRMTAAAAGAKLRRTERDGTMRQDGTRPDRRRLIAGAGAAGLALAASRAFAAEGHSFAGNPFRDRFQSFRQTFRVEPDRTEAERIVANIVKSRPLRAGLIEALVPDIAENGNVVPVTFSVNCSMTGDDYPETVHIVALENPFPEIAKYHFTPACGAAEVSCRVRMRTSSELVFIAEMADGTVGVTERRVDVTLGACS